MSRFVLAAVLLVAAVSGIPTLAADPAPLIAKLKAVAGEGKGNREATAAWQELAKADATQAPAIIAGLDGAGPLAQNYLRAAVDAICQRTLQAGGKLPVEAFERLAMDVSHSARARRLAYEWLIQADANAEARLALAFLNDPALELRRDSVAKLLSQAEEVSATPMAISMYQKALAAGRDIDQIKVAAKALRGFKTEPDLPQVFGFATKWRIIGPFDNTGRKGFDTVYPPEKELAFDASYEGKTGPVKWVQYETKFDPKKVDLAKPPNDAFEYVACVDVNEAAAKLKEATAYAVTEIESPDDREVEIRLDSVNANKVWVNGQLVMANNVYHALRAIDQYVGKAQLKKGKNTILVKLCQNEQTQSWTIYWQFQLRVTDAVGTPIAAIKAE